MVYLNGTEVFRDNMPAGTITYATLAVGNAADDGTVFYETNASPALLVAGANLVAVEIHQASTTSTDLSFELELLASVSNSPPVITVPPTNQTVSVGGTATFAVAASGTPPLAYQWRKDGTNLADGGRITGATTASLTLSDVLPDDAGSYSVVVTNTYGAASSANAFLSVLNPTVSFPDPNLEAAVRSALAKPTGPLTALDMLGLTELRASGRGITNLAGLEWAGSLAIFDGNLNAIRDLAPLAGLLNLTEVDCWANDLTDASPLRDLTGLRLLDLGANLVTNALEVVTNMPGLEVLTLTYHPLYDATPLSGLTNLTSLSLFDTRLTDARPLAGLTRMRQLDLGGNAMTNTFAAVTNMPDLEWLVLNNHLLHDVTPLSGLTNLTGLHLWDTRLTDASPLHGLSRLRGLNLGANAVTNAPAAVTNMPALDWLVLNHNLLYDAAPLSGLTNLTSLLLWDTHLTDARPLLGLTRLRELNLGANGITNSLSVVTNMPGLELLVLNDHSLFDVAPLTALTNLVELHLWNTRITNVAPLVGLWKLRALQVGYNPLHDVSVLVSLTNLTWASLRQAELTNIDVLSAWPQLSFLDVAANWLDVNPGAPALAIIHSLLGRGAYVDYLPQNLTTLLVQPLSQTVAAGANVPLSVVATSTVAIAYQWLRDGACLPGATNATLSLSNVWPGQAGAYSVIVSNAYGAVTSQVATLSVDAAGWPVGRVARTGQTVSYRTGDDGHWHKGIAWASPRFTDHGDGTVTDNNTGLVWLKNANPCGATNWDGAIDYCNALQHGQAGLNDGSGSGDWRMPNINELVSVLDYGQALHLPAGHPFVGIVDEMYWTSTTMSGEENALAIHPGSSARIITYGKTFFGFPVWPVRGQSTAAHPAPVLKTGATASYRAGDDGFHKTGVAWVSPRLTDNGNGTITDNNTGLLWLKDVNAFGATNWNAAIDLANALADGAAGLTDGSVPGQWRLPNMRELFSLLACNNQPVLPTGHPFSNTLAITWSSTTDPADSTQAHYLYLYDANSYPKPKTDTNQVWAVRDPDPAPVVVLQPQSQTVPAGTNVTFTVLANGTPPLSYQWRKDGTNLADGGPISNATTATLALSAVQAGDAGLYAVVVTNAFGAVTSTVARLGVIPLPRPPAVAAGASAHTVGLQADGIVLAVGYNGHGECDVLGWSNIVAVAAGAYHTVGLQADGTVVGVGYNDFGQCNVSGWSNIVAVAADGNHTVGLKADGTVIAVGDNSSGQCDVAGWTHIVAVAAGGFHTIGLKGDGTVVTVGHNGQGQCNVSGWSNIVAVAAGLWHTVGLRADGTVVAVGSNAVGQCEVSGWSTVVALAAGAYHTLGLRADGALVAVGANSYGQCNVSGWSNIVAVAPGGYHTAGLQADGTVVAVGYNDYGQCYVAGWFLGPAPDLNLQQALVGYWHFDGDSLDSSGLGRTLALNGGVGFASGLLGQALDLPNDMGKSASRVEDDAAFDFADRDFTVQVWVNYRSTSGEQVLIEKFDGCCGPGWTLTKVNNQLVFWAVPAMELWSPPQTLSTGAWHQVVARRTGSTLDLLLDGSRMVVTNVGTASIPDTARGLFVGRRNTATVGPPFPMNGFLDEVAIWTNALNNAQIAWLYNAGAGRSLAPSLLTQPQTQSVPAGSLVSFTVEATGSEPLSYQWRKDDTNLTDGGTISGATTASLTLSNILPANAGGYSVVVSNTFGAVTSQVAMLRVAHFNPLNGHYYEFVAGQLTWQEARLAAEARSVAGMTGHLATITSREENDFLVQVVPAEMNPWMGGFQPPGSPEPAGNWQWVTGEPLDFTAWLSWPAQPDNHRGDDAMCFIMWSWAIGTWADEPSSDRFPYLVEYEPLSEVPQILVQPQNVRTNAGATVTFQVTATGSEPLGYQWRKDGTNLADGGRISGAATASLTLEGVQSGDAGGYAVVVSNGFGAVTSQVAVLTVSPLIIASVSANSGAVGSSVTITGSGFSAVSGSNIVYFGAVRGAVTGASSTQLVVTVPAGASYAPVSVTVGGLTAYAPAPFVVTFDSTGVIDAGSFAPALAFPTVTHPASVAIGDFDGDGKPDLAAPNDSHGAGITVLRNTGPPGIIGTNSFAERVDLPALVNLSDAAFADVDGDGRLDLLTTVTSYPQGVSVYRNTATTGTLTSTSFAARVNFPIGSGSHTPHKLAISDLDGDGRPDLVAACSANGESPFLAILRNTATPDAIDAGSFAPAVDFALWPEGYPFDVAVADFDGDGKRDLAVLNSSSNLVSVFRNVTTPGEIGAGSFASRLDFATGANPYGVGAGDLDGDGKPELVTANFSGHSVSVLRNTGASGSISFADRVELATGPSPVSVAIGDVNGDSRPDLATANNNFGLPNATISVLRNAGSGGGIATNSFAARVDFPAGITPRRLAIGDLDCDGKPDLTVAQSVYGSEAAVLVLRNTMPQLQCLPPPSGLVAWWPGDGTSMDIGGSNHGFLMSGATFAPGKVGQAFSLDGADDYVRIPDCDALDLGLETEFTIALWFSQTGVRGGGYRLVDKVTAGVGDGYGMDTYPSGQNIRMMTPDDCYGSTQYSLDEWHHVAATYSNGTVTIYLDGNVDGTRTGARRPPTNSLDLFLGAPHAGPASLFFHGLLDEVCIFNRALAATEVQAIVTAGSAGMCKAAPWLNRHPMSQVRFCGETVQLSVEARGAEPLSLQWQKDAVRVADAANITGAKTATLTLSNAQPADAGGYSVVVSNAFGVVTSQVAVLTVLVPPPTLRVNGQVVTTNAVTVVGPATVALETPVADGVIYFTLDGSDPDNGWEYDGPFSVEQSVIVRAVVYTPDFGAWAEGEPVFVDVLKPPSIRQAPASQVVSAEATVTLAVEATGTPPLSYQWFLEGAPLGDGTNATFAFTAMAGPPWHFFVEVSNPWGAATSSTATVTVLLPPGVVTQPSDFTVAPGATVVLCIEVTGTPPLRYQWRKNGVNIPGATNACYTNLSVQLADGGSYTVIVANEAGSLLSQPARLTVAVPPAAPGDAFADRVLLTGSSNCVSGTNLFATKEPGEPNHAGKPGGKSVWYRWTAPFDGVATFRTVGSLFDTLLAVYTGSEVANLTFVASDEDAGGFLTSALSFNADQGQEYAIAIDGFGGAGGDFVLCWDLQPAPEPLPVIVTHPRSQTVTNGASVTFTVVAQGPNLAYQWTFSGAGISGATGLTLSIPAAQPTNVGTYTVRVSNTAGAAESQPAILEIGPFAELRSADKFEDLFLTNTVSPSPLKGRLTAGATASLPPVSAGTLLSQVLNTTNSTTSEGESNPCGGIGGASRWVTLIPAADGLMVVDTTGSTFDTMLAVYFLTVPDDLTSAQLVACDDNGAADGLRSRVLFRATRDVPYFARVDGNGGSSGLVVLNWGLGEMPPPPPPLTNPPVPVREGETVTLATATNGVPPPWVQWLHEGRALAGATQAVLVIRNLQPGHAGLYSVVLGNFLGAVTGEVARLRVDVRMVSLAASTFDGDTDGWTVFGDAEPVEHAPMTGNPGGCAAARDRHQGRYWYWQAPQRFLCNKAGAYGGLLSFDLRQDQPGGLDSHPDLPDVVLVGEGLMVTRRLPTLPGTNWTSYKLPLVETAGWRVGTNGPPATQTQFLRVLGTLSEVRIRGEFSTEKDVGGLDNVSLLAVSTNQMVWLASRWRPDGRLVLEWPSLPAGFQLETADNLTAPNWTLLEATADPACGVQRYEATNVFQRSQQFFRVKKL